VSVPVVMPKFEADAVDGRINAWLKAEGDPVSRGEPIAEIETDKATLELEAMTGGVLVKIVRQVGEDVPVGEVIAYIEARDGD